MPDSMQASAPTPIHSRKWRFCLGIALCAVLLSWWPQGLVHLRYERAALINGEEWRALTAHLVHLNAAHLLLNLMGLFLLCELLWEDLPLRHGFGLLTCSAIGISTMLWWRHPELAWYAGFSGALHGLWAGCALASLMAGRTRTEPESGVLPQAVVEQGMPGQWPKQKLIGAAGLALLAVKLIAEALFGASPSTVQVIGEPVITSAHFYGASAGVCYVLLWRSMQAMRLKR